MGALTRFLEFAVEKELVVGIQKGDEVAISKLVQQAVGHVADNDIIGFAKGENGKLLGVLSGLEKAGVSIEPSVLASLKNPQSARLIEMGLKASPEGKVFEAAIEGRGLPSGATQGAPQIQQPQLAGNANTLQWLLTKRGEIKSKPLRTLLDVGIGVTAVGVVAGLESGAVGLWSNYGPGGTAWSQRAQTRAQSDAINQGPINLNP